MRTAFCSCCLGNTRSSSRDFAHGGFQNICKATFRAGRVVFPAGAGGCCSRTPLFSDTWSGLSNCVIAAVPDSGIWVRPTSVVAALFMLTLTLATWWEPGHGVPLWRYFGAELDHIPLLFLFLIFFAADAGQTWGLDGRKRICSKSCIPCKSSENAALPRSNRVARPEQSCLRGESRKLLFHHRF